MILQPFLAKECCKLHKIRLFLIDFLENHTHGMTDVCMMYMPGASDALGQIMTIVTYDVIGSISCRLCPGTGSRVIDFVRRSMLSSERLFFKLLFGLVILSLELVFLRCKFLVLFTKTF